MQPFSLTCKVLIEKELFFSCRNRVTKTQVCETVLFLNDGNVEPITQKTTDVVYYVILLRWLRYGMLFCSC